MKALLSLPKGPTTKTLSKCFLSFKQIALNINVRGVLRNRIFKEIFQLCSWPTVMQWCMFFFNKSVVITQDLMKSIHLSFLLILLTLENLQYKLVWTDTFAYQASTWLKLEYQREILRTQSAMQWLQLMIRSDQRSRDVFCGRGWMKIPLDYLHFLSKIWYLRIADRR